MILLVSVCLLGNVSSSSYIDRVAKNITESK